jgi:hypothetical protein
MSRPGPEPQRIPAAKAASYLHGTYGWPLDHCERALAIATELQPAVDAEPTDHGFAEIVRDDDAYIITDFGSRHRK